MRVILLNFNVLPLNIMCYLCTLSGSNSACGTVLKTIREKFLNLKSPSQGRESVGTLTRSMQTTGLVEGFLFLGGLS